MSDTGRAGLPRAFFLPTPTGQRFCLFHPAQGPRLQGSVLYLHPFAEELNTTRRVVARQARALAQAGFAVLQIDLLGCGDSEGEFADATWEAWLEDAHRAYDWLAEHAPGPVWLWGMRSGALLATALAARLPRPAHLLLWQPVINGQQMLQQFLRLHAAGQWLTDGNKDLGKDTTPAQALASGASVDIAGYTLSPALAQGLSAARMLAPVPAMPAHLIWIDTTTQPEPTLNPAASTHLDTWRKAGWSVNDQAINSPAFWQTIGTDEAPALLAATLQALKGCGDPTA
ncbi:hydrolase 2, exosortase A system-associated [Hydrogenophaga sp.]|uniref:hydrolase 2, exosortase A system-associated n=1 Tax=Hydrogenophaga sp. TaxID=1904254 RepID=UPI00272F1586|nr:hydrolase 2, exosortase A system-associated [Hydrogenophaga sp.]MDP1684486.1 hydrolase 2, exosortase A system-associated [Hydrogenophaga sp.]